MILDSAVEIDSELQRIDIEKFVNNLRFIWKPR